MVSMDRRLSTAEHDPKTIGNAPSPGQTLRWAPPEREGVWRARAQRRAAQPRTFEAGPAQTAEATMCECGIKEPLYVSLFRL